MSDDIHDLLRYKNIDENGKYTTINEKGEPGSISWLGIQWKWLKSCLSRGHWGTYELDQGTQNIINIANKILQVKNDTELSFITISLLNLKKINKREGGNLICEIDRSIDRLALIEISAITPLANAIDQTPHNPINPATNQPNTALVSNLEKNEFALDERIAELKNFMSLEKNDAEFAQFFGGVVIGKSYKGIPCKGSQRESGDEKYRTIFSAKTIRRVLIADPENAETFKALKISKDQLLDIRTQIAKAFGKNDFREVTLHEKLLLLVFILYQDIFKMEEMMKLIYPDDKNKWTIQNHDRAFKEACNILLKPDSALDQKGKKQKDAIAAALPLLAKLPREDIACIEKMLSYDVSIPQLLQGEASLESAKAIAGTKPYKISSGAQVNILQLFRLLDWFDVAGSSAKSPENWGLEDTSMEAWLKQAESGTPGKSQGAMLSILFKGFKTMEKTIDSAGTDRLYQTFIANRAKELNITKGVPENADDQSRLTVTDITRICMMLRQVDPQMCAAIREGLGSMSEEERVNLKKALERFYYYSPDLMCKAVTGLTAPKEPVENAAEDAKQNYLEKLEDYKKSYVERVKFAATLLGKLEVKAQEQEIPSNETLNVAQIGNVLAAAANFSYGRAVVEKGTFKINRDYGIATIGSSHTKLVAAPQLAAQEAADEITSARVQKALNSIDEMLNSSNLPQARRLKLAAAKGELEKRLLGLAKPKQAEIYICEGATESATGMTVNGRKSTDGDENIALKLIVEMTHLRKQASIVVVPDEANKSNTVQFLQKFDAKIGEISGKDALEFGTIYVVSSADLDEMKTLIQKTGDNGRNVTVLGPPLGHAADLIDDNTHQIVMQGALKTVEGFPEIPELDKDRKPIGASTNTKEDGSKEFLGRAVKRPNWSEHMFPSNSMGEQTITFEEFRLIGGKDLFTAKDALQWCANTREQFATAFASPDTKTPGILLAKRLENAKVLDALYGEAEGQKILESMRVDPKKRVLGFEKFFAAIQNSKVSSVQEIDNVAEKLGVNIHEDIIEQYLQGLVGKFQDSIKLEKQAIETDETLKPEEKQNKLQELEARRKDLEESQNRCLQMIGNIDPQQRKAALVAILSAFKNIYDEKTVGGWSVAIADDADPLDFAQFERAYQANGQQVPYDALVVLCTSLGIKIEKGAKIKISDMVLLLAALKG